MKIKSISVKNFKPISDQEINLNGCSAIITAANDMGKTSLLQGLIDRFRSEKPDKIVKEQEAKGNYRMELTDGSIIEWNFTQKSERLSYTTAGGIKQTSGVIGAIGEKYFGKGFDIDGFLRSGPKKQQEKMEQVTGVDLSDVDERYNKAYQERTEANRELKRISSQKREQPEEVEKPDVQSIKKEISNARKENEVYYQAKSQVEKLESIDNDVRRIVAGTDYEDLFDHRRAKEIRDEIDVPEKVDLSDLEQKLDTAQEKLRKYDSYERDKKDYEQWILSGKKAREKATKADEKVKAIEQEKREIIEQAEMPEGFNIDEDGLKYNGFILDENQLSKSAIYIAALKLGSLAVGKVKTLHFDASALDKNNLQQVQQWAETEGFQLLIERPDYEGGEIKYQIIEE